MTVSRRILYTAGAFGVGVAFFAALLLTGGCRPNSSSTRNVITEEKEDYLIAVRELLRKERDVDGCKTITQQLNHQLNQTKSDAPAPSAEDRVLLERQLNLTPDELRELSSPLFTTLDAYHLHQALLIHDALQSLGLGVADNDADRLKEAEAAFAWSVRQVWLSTSEGTAWPALFVLRRGHGTYAERAAVVMEAFEQLGFDACLIAADRAGGAALWGVGAGIGSDVYVFDPRGGRPVRTEDGKIATLRQVRAKPELLKSVQQAGDTVDLIAIAKDSKALISPALTSMAPRMRLLEEAAPLKPPLRLSVNVRERLQRMTHSAERAELWNPRQGIGAPVRALAHFLPIEEGGFDRQPRGQRMVELYQFSLAPLHLLPPILREESISGEPGHRLRSQFGHRFIELYDMPNQPRDQLLRGQLGEATDGLVERLRRINVFHERIAINPTLDADAAHWIEQLRAAAAQLGRSRPGDPTEAAARAQIEGLQKRSDQIFLFIEKAAVEPYGMHVTLQLALCKHEQALRQSNRQSGDSAAIRDGWQTAISWWANFLNKYGQLSYMAPGMREHARRLSAEAQAAAHAPLP